MGILGIDARETIRLKFFLDSGRKGFEAIVFLDGMAILMGQNSDNRKIANATIDPDNKGLIEINFITAGAIEGITVTEQATVGADGAVVDIGFRRNPLLTRCPKATSPHRVNIIDGKPDFFR
jgi:hypothetical protein